MLSRRFENLNPYIPGEQPKDRIYIKLNANENPYPPHKSVIKAIKKAVSSQKEKLGLYPDPDSENLRTEIANMINATGGVLSNPNAKEKLNFKLTKENIFCGNGSDEVLSFVFYTFFDSDRPLILPEFTYSFYPVYCGYYNIPMEKIPLTENWELNKDAMIKASTENESSTIFANPNAPTGIALSTEEIRQMIKASPKNKVFIVDEAYADFSTESAIPLLNEFDNLVIIRTFSKSLSFAGMRLGYVVSSPKLIKSIFTVKNSFNHFPVDFITQTAGIASCKAYKYYAENSKKVIEERESLTKFLRDRNWFVIDSKTNFIFAKNEKYSGKELYEKIKAKGILIRHFAIDKIDNFLRITIGTKKQMNELKKVIDEIK